MKANPIIILMFFAGLIPAFPQNSSNTAEKTSVTPTLSATEAAAALERAETNLRISRDTEKQIETELAALKAKPGATELEIARVESYLKRARRMTADNQAEVDRLKKGVPAKPAPPPKPIYQVPVPAPAPARIDEDPLMALERKLNRQIADFDDLLLGEQEKIAERRNAVAGNESVSDATGEGERGKGGHGGSTGPGKNPDSGDVADGQTESGADGKVVKAESTEGKPGEANSEGGGVRKGGKMTGKGKPAGPSTRPGAEDDDIVARQLREAAEKETDPELREKLWKEYDDYKQSTK